MEWLNYHHLLYFWMVAREGTVTGAARELRLAPSTVSEQLRRLEESLGQPLFKKSGRNIVLTDVGRTVFRYADEIFALGRELMDFVQGRQMDRLHLNVGLSMVVPKQVALRLLEPVLNLKERIHLVCREGRTEDLLADLALHHLDIVITDAPLGPDSRIRAFNHLLGECGVMAMARPSMVEAYGDDFPQSLDRAPVLLATSDSVLRRQLDRWFHDAELHPEVVAEFDDSALLKVFGQRGLGVFFIPEFVAGDVARQYEVEPLGLVPDITEHFYAVSVQRQLRHPAVLAISEFARQSLSMKGAPPST
ncbi:MAG: transcriptional activator NhaR [Myxococcota bacterium]